MDDERLNNTDTERPPKETIPSNYRSITRLSLRWKFMTIQIRKEIYFWLICRGLFVEEQKGYRKGRRGAKVIDY